MNARALLSKPAPLALAATLVMTLAAQDPEDARVKPALQSGPPAGMQLTPVQVYAPTGPYQGKTFDAAKEIGNGPGVLMFIHVVNREVAAMIRGLDTLGREYGILGFKSFGIHLGSDRTQAEEAAQRFSRALRMHNPILVSTDGHEGPGDYALNRKAFLTVVVVNKGAVKESICITDTGPKDVPRLQKWIESVAGKLPKNGVELARLQPDDPVKLKQLIAKLYDQNRRQAEQFKQQQQRRGRNNQRRRRNPGRRGRDMERGRGRGNAQRPTSRPAKGLPGKIPDDPELESLMRGLVGKFNTNDDVDDMFERIEDRVGEDRQLRQAAVEGFKRLLSMTYGTEYARKRFRKYVAKHDAPSKAKKKKL